MHRILAQDFSFDLKPVDQIHQFSFCQAPTTPLKQFWVKLKGNISEFVYLYSHSFIHSFSKVLTFTVI